MIKPDLLREAATRLAEAGIDSPRREARLLWEHAERTAADFQSVVARRAAREPFAYITGVKEFWSLDFEVGPGALVPRPDTETLIEAALSEFTDRAAPLRILDLGTGSGCLLVTALTLYPNASGVGIDLSPDALAWAERNTVRHGVAARATFIEGGWEAGLGQRFDLIFSNPPYLTTGELAGSPPELGWEPPEALEAGSDGLDAYRALGPVIAATLGHGGAAFVEIGAGQGPGASVALAQAGLEIPAINADLSGTPRCIVARAPGKAGVPWVKK